MELAIGILIGIFLGLGIAALVITVGARRKLRQIREVGDGLTDAMRHLRLAEDVLATDPPPVRLVEDLDDDDPFAEISPESS